MPTELYATLHTTAGDIRLCLFGDHAPKTVANFVELAEGGRQWRDPRSGEMTERPLYARAAPAVGSTWLVPVQ